MLIFDSHAHYDDESFDEDREKVLEELKQSNVVGILNCGSSLQGARDSVKLARENSIFYAAVGIHPEYADKVNDELIEEIRKMTEYEKVRAIGEIGLDYYYDENPPREIQKYAFIKQMELAKKLNLPVVIHNRDAHADTLEILKMFPEVKGVIHCFSGSVEFARECIKLGYYIGFTGVVTFKNAKKIVEVAKEVPLDRILVETDCPYMAPTPFRGKRNRSEYISYILEEIANIKEISIDTLSNQTISNVKELIKIK
ncbi:TatD family hydrolase [Clostridium sp. MSJ-11]|uniref:TatD family hydrolase n=1 Tax=Clostridium mobile TaxID=2841512 RepID=A0ABS6ELV6_9CLOT|nr:TatD family hydrolase [Clostridium mobile]MBU5486210.1 TatD family hydrolase [Clostridium mobile]